MKRSALASVNGSIFENARRRPAQARRCELERKAAHRITDLPAMIQEKEELLAGAKPRCQLRRIKVDLSDFGARTLALQEALTSSTQALVITEGPLVYLDDTQVSQLSRDLAALPGVRYWILDLASPAILQMLHKGMGTNLTNAPMKFAPANGIAFLKR